VNPDPRLAVVARLLSWPVARWGAASPVSRVLDVEPSRELGAIATATTAVALTRCPASGEALARAIAPGGPPVCDA
jgi:hypothetical protein